MDFNRISEHVQGVYTYFVWFKKTSFDILNAIIKDLSINNQQPLELTSYLESLNSQKEEAKNIQEDIAQFENAINDIIKALWQEKQLNSSIKNHQYQDLSLKEKAIDLGFKDSKLSSNNLEKSSEDEKIHQFSKELSKQTNKSMSLQKQI